MISCFVILLVALNGMRPSAVLSWLLCLLFFGVSSGVGQSDDIQTAPQQVGGVWLRPDVSLDETCGTE